jgi:2-polyprenyl-3-methyl-5-hydroxy-6-metoxy-1,4-benzoquinol methylase
MDIAVTIYLIFDNDMSNKEKPSTKFFQDKVEDYEKEFYSSGYRTFMSVRLDRFLKEIKSISLPERARCLDAGCGPGYLSKALHELGYTIDALDSSPEMLRIARALFETDKGKQSPNINEGDIENLPYGRDSFDLVASAGVIEYLANDQIVLDEFHKVLKPGGFLVLSSTYKYSPIGMFEPIIETVKRVPSLRNTCNFVLKNIGGTPVRPREFHVRKHGTKEFVGNVEKAGFNVLNTGFFYALPWPHPIDRVFPKISSAIGKRIEFLSQTPFKYTLEGILIVAQKPLSK